MRLTLLRVDLFRTDIDRWPFPTGQADRFSHLRGSYDVRPLDARDRDGSAIEPAMYEHCLVGAVVKVTVTCTVVPTRLVRKLQLCKDFIKHFGGQWQGGLGPTVLIHPFGLVVHIARQVTTHSAGGLHFLLFAGWVSWDGL